MYKIVEFSHILIKNKIESLNKDNAIVIDATCGMGNDTLYLAKLLNHKGTIHAYDIQDVAIDATKKLIASNGYENVYYHLESHENINIAADIIIYNLGYLPNHDKRVSTTVLTTINSIRNNLNLMEQNENMLIIICAYVGHIDGQKEAKALDELCHNLDPKKYLVTKFQNYNRELSPFILTISKNTFNKTKK